jgi:hypothetical protein
MASAAEITRRIQDTKNYPMRFDHAITNENILWITVIDTHVIIIIT